jgi:hypothetical protein
MKKFPWWMLIVFLVLLVLAFGVALPFFARGAGMMRGWGYLPGHMGGWGMMGAFPLMGGAWMILRLLVPLAVLALVVVGVVALIRAVARPKVAMASCPACSRPVQAGWVACPNCGQKL